MKYLQMGIVICSTRLRSAFDVSLQQIPTSGGEIVRPGSATTRESSAQLLSLFETQTQSETT